MNTKIICFCAFFASLGSAAFSQSTVTANKNTPDSTIFANKKAVSGTYQIIIRKSKFQPVFTDDILVDVEKNRDENEVRYLTLGENAKVKILPRKTINAPGFIPLEEVIYVEQF